jgi:hypothetical protein
MADRIQELATALLELKARYPHWRFGQLVCNVAAWAGEDKPGEVWDVSDEQLLAAAKAHLERLKGAPGDSKRAAG